MIEKSIQAIFADAPDVLFGYADISYSPLSNDYQSALVFAVPHTPQITMETYSEDAFEQSLRNAKTRELNLLTELERLFQCRNIKYYIPPMAQRDETELLAEFSFKFAAVNAGLGWIGKNDVLITERYGPRVRLSVVLIDYPFPYGTKVTESRCPADCTKCVDACPHKALTGAIWDIDAKRNDLIDYHLCNERRSRYIAIHGRKHACGFCMAACPFGTNA